MEGHIVWCGMSSHKWCPFICLERQPGSITDPPSPSSSSHFSEGGEEHSTVHGCTLYMNKMYQFHPKWTNSKREWDWGTVTKSRLSGICPVPGKQGSLGWINGKLYALPGMSAGVSLQDQGLKVPSGGLEVQRSSMPTCDSGGTDINSQMLIIDGRLGWDHYSIPLGIRVASSTWKCVMGTHTSVLTPKILRPSLASTLCNSWYPYIRDLKPSTDTDGLLTFKYLPIGTSIKGGGKPYGYWWLRRQILLLIQAANLHP